MKIEQKKLSNQHSFTFNSDSFNFAYRDKSGSGDVDIPYAEFPLKSSVQIEKNLWLRNVGYLWCLLGLFQVGSAIFASEPLTGKGFWLVLGIACLLWSHFTTVTYSVFRTDKGAVFVIQDRKSHDQIIDEITSRRRKQLLSWYGEINFDNDLEREIAKFKWLAEQKVLSAEQADQKIALAQAAFHAKENAPSITLN